MSHISRSASASGWRLLVPAAKPEQVMFENPESGGRAGGHWRDGLERLVSGFIGASIPALLAFETLAREAR
jgi:hypothetical protein